MGLLHPELLLLLVPVLVLAQRVKHGHPGTAVVRLIVAALLVFAAAVPVIRQGTPGRDVLIVVDRSASMPAGSDERARELIALAEGQRAPGDRVGVVSFGERIIVDHAPTDGETFAGFTQSPGNDGSRLAEALDVATSLVPHGRPGTLLVISDGESQGDDPEPIARRAFARGLRVDVLPAARGSGPEVSVDRLVVPHAVEADEPFAITAWLHSDRTVDARVTLMRGSEPITSLDVALEPGSRRLVFRDLVRDVGLATYRLDVQIDDDPVPENNTSVAAVMVDGPRAVLVLNELGTPDSLTAALTAAGLAVAVARPEDIVLDAVTLTRFRAVVLENVAADRLGRGISALATFVRERGGGLLMTGGRASFGVGGYHLSTLDSVLPVSMELRQEHRKLSLAMAIAMDRSGSMSMSAGVGLTKMDLANKGAAAAIELLSPFDAVSVIAVDSAAHVVQPLVNTVDKDDITRRVRSIQSMGGGIFVYSAMIEAVRQLRDAEQVNKHIVLFADAADAEEQEGCIDLATDLHSSGVTLSVIALGSRSDSDASFLIDLASAGGGEAYFTLSPTDLPRLFALDTLTASRGAFIEEATPSTVLPDLLGMGDLPSNTFPVVGGYNLAYLEPGAVAGVATTDEYHAPLFAFWYRGLGRAAAYTGQVGGEFGSSLVAWDGYAAFIVTAVRWLLGQEEPDEVFASVSRDGRDALVSVEIDPRAPLPPDTAHLTAHVIAPDGSVDELVLERDGDNNYSARTPLADVGISLATVSLDGKRGATLPPLVLPYSPEFERRTDPGAGKRALHGLARETSGIIDPSTVQLFEGDRGGDAVRPFVRPLIVLAIVLLLLEIAMRRLSLWGAVTSRVARREAVTEEPGEPASGAATAPKGKAPKPRTKPDEREAPAAAPPATTSLSDAMERARKRSRQRLDR